MPAPSTYQRIYAVVSRIPRGRVATYGQVALLAGMPRQARLIGYALSALPAGSAVPWHRVVNARGQVSVRAGGHGFEQVQGQLLHREGVRMKDGVIALEQHQWRPRVASAPPTKKTTKKTSRVLGFVLLLLAARAQAAEVDPQAAFTHGVALMDRHQYGDALVQLKQAERAFPAAAPLLWNLGIASVEVGSHRQALGYWRKYQLAQSDDWKVLPKMIQAHQALGDVRARDRAIKDLRALRQRWPDSELGRAERFCREQLVVAGRKLLVFESFEPKGDPRIVYRFALTNEAGQETAFFSLGSSEAATQVARDLGAVARDGRAYHLDRYEGNDHQTYAHFNRQPPYEAVRKTVVAILQGKPLPSSRSGKD